MTMSVASTESSARILSPRLAHPDQVADFRMEVCEENVDKDAAMSNPDDENPEWTEADMERAMSFSMLPVSLRETLSSRKRDPQTDAVFSFPVYLEPDVNDFLSRLAEHKNVDVQDLVNSLLRADISLIQTVQ